MGKYTQADRPLRIETKLGPDALLLEGFGGEEAVSSLFHYHLDLLSEDPSIDAEGLLRSPVTVTLGLPDGGKRPIHGLVRRFVQRGQLEGVEGDTLTAYQAEVVPWPWFMSLSTDCKIFQDLTVLEIVEKVFQDQGWSDFQVKCVKTYPKREYCVQYRETHLDFVSRLLEEEGIYYFFEHSESKHTLLLADDPNAVKPCSQADVRLTTTTGFWEGQDVVTSLEREHAAHAGKVTLRDYDFLKPSTLLESSLSGSGEGELYDYPGVFTERSGGERLARLRMEEEEGLHEVVRGGSTCRAFSSGTSFTLKEHYRGDVNQAYHLLRVRQQAYLGDYRSGGADFEYQNEFVAIPKSVPFRPPRATPRPVVRGSQTAVVVGKEGEEIWVDKHGRVKVKFHWDRKLNSSCWIRVSTTWAGKNWGFIQIPRIGQEVIVDFLEGDPDRPIITGRVYNAEQTPPYKLPDDQTKSGVKSRSSKKGGTSDYNEISFEDLKDKELVLIHAQKDLTVEVENDEQREVGHDRTTVVQNDEKRTVKKGKDVVVIEKGHQTLDVKVGNRTVTLDQGNLTTKLKMGNMDTKLDMGDMSTQLKMGNMSTKLDMGNLDTQLKMGNVTTKLSLGKASEEAMQSIEFKVGASSVKIDQTGVTIKGMMIKIEGTIQTEVKGMMTNVKGDAMLMMKGGITMIN
ncbi:MAG: type VI secretion system tip protein VgrG [Gemmatimonadota bacterium]|jgi:type VI secretion system secreted protein VgrG